MTAAQFPLKYSRSGTPTIRRRSSELLKDKRDFEKFSFPKEVNPAHYWRKNEKTQTGCA